jgi:hypothetical protein
MVKCCTRDIECNSNDYKEAGKNITTNNTTNNNNINNGNEIIASELSVNCFNSLKALYDTVQISFCKSITASSISWLEMMIVEISLRNRDRFAIIWPILKSHYIKTLGDPYELPINYITERLFFFIYIMYIFFV